MHIGIIYTVYEQFMIYCLYVEYVYKQMYIYNFKVPRYFANIVRHFGLPYFLNKR